MSEPFHQAGAQLVSLLPAPDWTMSVMKEVWASRR
jgi:hypothetical protein